MLLLQYIFHGWTLNFLLLSVSLFCPFLLFAVVSHFKEFILQCYRDFHSTKICRCSSTCHRHPFPQLYVFFLYMCSAKIQQYLAIKLLIEISSPLLEWLFWLQPQKWLSLKSGRTVKLLHVWQWWFLFSGFPNHKFSSVQNARLPSGKMAHLWDAEQRAKQQSWIMPVLVLSWAYLKMKGSIGLI